MFRSLGALMLLAVVGCDEPTQKIAPAAQPDPARSTASATNAEVRQPLTQKDLLGRELREKSFELLKVENQQIVFNMWTAILTITNGTTKVLPANEHTVQCVLFNENGQRVGLTMPISNTAPLAPGETFTNQVMTGPLPDGVKLATHECVFQS